MDKKAQVASFSTQEVRIALLAHKEIAIIDVREESAFAEGHPLFAANIPYSRLETEMYTRVPRKDTLVILYDNGEDLAAVSAQKLLLFGYSNVHLLQGGFKGWVDSGEEVFIDVNSPSKAFGELVESKRHTPSLSPSEVKRLLDNEENVIIFDVRRYDEYHIMSIPQGISVPGAELVLRFADLAPDPATRIIVNCAGRTRSIIGTQSLINAGVPNPVSALRNGTIGWTLAGQSLEHHKTNRFPAEISSSAKNNALMSSRKVADQAGVKRINLRQIERLLKEKERTTYRFDVRAPEEYQEKHLPGFISVPGGQLVQETDHYASVRGARIVLADQEGTRANMTASWLAQMAWEVYVIDGLSESDMTESGPGTIPTVPYTHPGQENIIHVDRLFELFNQGKKLTVVDFSTAKEYLQFRIPGAWFALRSQLNVALKALPESEYYVLTSKDGTAAGYAYSEFQDLVDKRVLVLEGGNASWATAQREIETGETNANFASPRIDRYQRPYEGTNNSKEAMQAYLDWEYGLVAQLERDSSHFFNVL